MARVSTGEAAAALNKNRKTLQRWAKRPDYPADETGLVDVEELRAWAEARGLLERQQEDGRPTIVEQLVAEAPSAPILRIHEGAPADALPEVTADEKSALETLVGGDPTALIHLAARVDMGLLKRLAAMGRTRRELAEAERRETDNRRVRGELVPLEEVRRWWAGHVGAARSVLQALAGKLAPELSGRVVPYDEVYAAIERELEAAQSGLARARFDG